MPTKPAMLNTTDVPIPVVPPASPLAQPVFVFAHKEPALKYFARCAQGDECRRVFGDKRSWGRSAKDSQAFKHCLMSDIVSAAAAYHPWCDPTHDLHPAGYAVIQSQHCQPAESVPSFASVRPARTLTVPLCNNCID